jgi:AcrR family transcriptional regulator
MSIQMNEHSKRREIENERQMRETSDPIQQQLIAARRNQILDAATQIFAEKGFHRATVRAVAQAAGVADGTIYTYFASKDELLIGILDRLNQTDERPEHFAQVGHDGDFRAFFTEYLRERLALVFASLPVLQALLPEVMTNGALRQRYFEQILQPTFALGEHFFHERMAAGELRSLDVAVTVRVVAGMVFGVAMLRLLGDNTGGAEQTDELAGVLATLLLEGLLPEGKGND